MQTKTTFFRGILVLLCAIGFPISTFALTTRVNVDTNEIEANNSSSPVGITPDGRFTLFTSLADNLVPDDTNGLNDIFVRDAFSGTTVRVNIGVSGNELNNDSALQYTNANTLNITSNGRFVLFYSAADNVVPNDTNWQYDIFVRDLRNNTTLLVSSDSSGNIADGYSYPVSMSADGRYVLFFSDATNLVPGDTNTNSDVFVKDLITGITTRVSVDSNGVEGNSFSNPISLTPDGRYALFVSTADNFASGDNNFTHDVFVRDIQNNTTTLITADSSGNISNNYSEAVGITPDGRYVLFNGYGDNLVPGDTNGASDVFVRDTRNNTTTLISTDSSGNIGNNYSYAVSITPDGRYVLFNSESTNLVAGDVNSMSDAFVRDTQNNTTTKALNTTLQLGFGFNEIGTNAIAMSSGGRYILFNAQVQDYYFYYVISNDLYITDTLSGTLSRVDIDIAGTILRDFNQNPSNSYGSAITPDGKYVLFNSDAQNLVVNDTNGQNDAFVNQRQLMPGVAPTIVSPVDGSYRNTLSDIMVEGIGNSGSDIRVTFLGNQFITTTNPNGNWNVQLPSQLDAEYTIYAQQKDIGATDWSLTGESTFVIDTISPTTPIIINPTENQLVVGGNMSIVGVGEPGGIVTVKVGSITKVVGVDGMGNWSAGPFIIAPGYKYAIVAKQSDLAGNQSNWSDTRTIYGVVAGTLTVNDSDYIADLLLTKKGMSGTGSLTNTNPNENIRYTLDYLNVGNTYATGVIIYEEIPTNTCFTIGSISGLNSDYIVEYSNNKGLNYAYLPAGIVGSQDCTITNFRVKYKIPYEAKMNVVSDEANGVYNGTKNNGGITLSDGPITIWLTGLVGDSTSNTVGDFNNDGYDDAVIGSYRYPSRNNLTDWILWGTGGDISTSFAELESSSTYPDSETHNVGKGDFNGDGYLDAFVLNGDAYYGIDADDWIYYGSATGFSKMIITGSAGNGENVIIADYNNDGYDDAILLNGTYQAGGDRGNSKVMWGGATGVSLATLNNVRGTIFDGTTGDINNDGYVDAIVGRGSFQDEIIVYGGTGLMRIQFLTGSAGSTWAFPKFDVNGDGFLDIVFANSPGPSKVMFGLATGGYNIQPVTLPTLPYMYSKMIDLDANGVQDMILPNANLEIVYGQTGVSYTGLSSTQILGPTGNPIPNTYTSWVAADLNGDGKKDMVVAPGAGNSNNQLIVIYGGSTKKIYLPISLNAWKMEAGDFNADGIDDVIVNPATGFGSENGLIILGSRGAQGSYTTILSSTGNNNGWDKLLIQEESISGDNKIEYSIFGVTGGLLCDTGNNLLPKGQSINSEIDISNITGLNSSICIKADFTLITGTVPPVLNSIIGTWNNEDIDSFTFDVKVNSGNFVGTTVTNTAYITSNVIELNTINNSDSHIFNGIPSVSNGGGYGGGIGGNGGGGNSSNGGTKDGGTKGNKDEIPKTVVKNDLTPQEVAEKVKEQRAKEVKEIDTSKPEKPIVETPKPITPTSVEIKPTTPNIAIKEAIVQTSYVSVGSTVEVKTVGNPALESEKKCYTPKEVVDITLGKNTTNKDQLVYQALLKSYDLTMFNDTDAYMPENGLKRYEAAKMFTNFAKYVLCREATNTYNNEYKDIENVDATLKPYIIQAYEYGILKGANGKFRPLDKITRKEFVAALMRMFINENMDIQNAGNNWDINYQEAFKAYGLESIVGVDEEINRYAMSKIIYKLYYNTTYEWTEKGYILPYNY